MPRTPVVVLSSVDPVERDATLMSLLLDAPRTVAVRHDIHDDEEGTLRRVVADATGVLEDEVLPLEHACLSCAVREDAVPTLHRLADGPWDTVVLALPVSAEPLPVVRALGWAMRPGDTLAALRLGTTVTTVDLATLEHDLLGDDLLDERGLALTHDDRRSVGEALAAQVGHADVVLVEGSSSVHAVASDLLDHVRATDGRRVDGRHRVRLPDLTAVDHAPTTAERRLDPAHVAPVPGAPTRNGVWTLDLHTDRPFHPERLLHGVERLGSPRVRSRGRFHVPSRPDTMCVWEGAGGQLSIGAAGPWGHRTPDTRLVVTGTGDEAPALREAFAELVLSEPEVRRGYEPWLGRPDVLAPWLGDRAPA
ncbi:cobalamin synthesis CobW domain protein [Cellulomonas flavigena DSM 20109]|uniref:Cobalamin synthesis CobW domain protein n=1 Tax=Cellulomonas flavigena (strain ATCC 482 / DSM 20109 / BCRC 11376 / JCM 18109 / NBRC 3775 / NCIMB 8073 / NRS 134) TaxID=446466 RepID=D5UG94_CELFN|nr:GTP-binding protein [Cellulomonas flavigena]ADG73077.1 cobalamin synthesis CobW domain protein [Cellulomonas flavigena DSM 20109]